MNIGIGADIGLVHDASAIVAVIREGDVYRVDNILEMRPTKAEPLKLSHVVGEFQAFALTYQHPWILCDHHVLGPAREYLTGAVELVPVHGGADAKAESYMLAKKLFQEGRVRVPVRHKRLIEQLRAVTARPTPGGGMKIDSPRRQFTHGDVASAFVLALTATVRAADNEDMRIAVPSSSSGWYGHESSGSNELREARLARWRAMGIGK